MVTQQNISLPLTELTAINPLDGRYRKRIQHLASFTSEYALIKTRFEVEIKYLIALSENKIIRPLTSDEIHTLENIYKNCTPEQAEQVKKLEQETRHDVKAMERTLRNHFQNSSLEDITEIIHLGLTSEDINNLSYRLMLKRATQQILLPQVQSIINTLVALSDEYKMLPMLARTHGQSAVPTTLGKELVVYAYRLFKQLQILKKANLTGKFSGAVGNFNALAFVYPDIDWITFSEKFVTSLELTPNIATTQINTYEDIIFYLQTLQRINSILIDFDQDMWRYISDRWFVQTVVKGEVGSSAMPQKVNPIDFENSEGNLGLGNAMIEHFARKLPISRLQRDLTDSTTMRNIGSILGYCLIGYTSTSTGLSRVKPNTEKIASDLNQDWAILTEAVQTLLRKENVKDPYSLIASLTHGGNISQDEWEEWIVHLPTNDSKKEELKKLSPQSYVGLASQIVEETIKEITSA